ncbi:MAG TPA: hypothetical protein VFT90_18445, partial [Chryseosolibacter sp.]|nr:hypothetical protein [Chryseosolibacter sp.]
RRDSVKLFKVYSDRNGVIEISTSDHLYKPHAGELLFPGTLVPQRYYRPIADKNIANLTRYREHFVYVDDKAVLSNAWAGNLYVKHSLPTARLLAGGKNFDFLISDGRALQYLKDSTIAWYRQHPEEVLDIIFDEERNRFLLLSAQSIHAFDPAAGDLKSLFSGNSFTCFAISGKHIIVGSDRGYFTIDAATMQRSGDTQERLPANELTTVEDIDGKLWFGSTRGAFMLRDDGKYNYYASRRWLPSDKVVDIAKGPDSSVLVLTDKGLAQIRFEKMTLQDKAHFFQEQVRNRHIRHGFNATLGYMHDGNVSTGSLEDSDNDGLWTSMYMGAEVFRYAVTKSEDALQNLRESMEAMERLYTINGVKGFPSRSFERRGYKYDDKPWRRAEHPEWDWKSTTSSDEAIGHMFIFGAMAELLDDEDLKQRAIVMMDSLMQHVVDNDMYLVDWNGEPTLWGKWHPDYVNARPTMVGDRKINASNITAMLQTAYHFTGKEIYKEKAFELMREHGYYENLMRPMKEIGRAPEDADDWSKMLSESWNHSDDEMYFLGYWGLYRYAFNDTLKANFKDAIIDHWQIERPEKEGAWNIFTALTGVEDFDLEEAIWYLQEYPLDLVHWRVTNSHRKDIEMIEPNFRNQTIAEVLPPDELPINRHNANRFQLDGGDGGTSEYSAGDIWLLPYWMGRYLGVIAAPENGQAPKQ